jgi:hypothetical protein
MVRRMRAADRLSQDAHDEQPHALEGLDCSVVYPTDSLQHSSHCRFRAISWMSEHLRRSHGGPPMAI